MFVFTKTELPEEHTERDVQSFAAGQGGCLIPTVCVDKALHELSEFEDLVEESKKTGQDWQIVFVACLSGKSGMMPTSADAEQPLNTMIEGIHSGMIANYLAYDRAGNLIQFV